MNLRLPQQRLVAILLFVSGATSLVYELVWSKHLANLLGNSGQAHSIVLATFMGGIALGAYLFGRAADRARSALRLYGYLELGIALYALAFPAILGALGSVFLAVAPSLGEGPRVVAKLLLAAASLVVPTTLMGGTVPALVRYLSQSLGEVRRELARLYAVNSLGASFGVFTAGVVLVPRAGLAAASAVAVFFNLVVALFAITASRRAREAAVPGAHPEPDTVYPASAVRAALFGVAVSGFTSMLYEVLWIRLLTIVLGASTYAFTLILTAFILGIGLGSFWLMRRRETKDALALFGRLQAALAVAVCVAIPLYVRLPHLFYVAQHWIQRTPTTWPWYQALVFFFCCFVLLLPTFLMGAAFPAGARVAASKVAELGRQLGGVYLWNTVGTIAGASLGGLALLPWLGIEGSFTLGVLLNVAAAAWALLAAPTRTVTPGRALWPAALGLAGLVLLAGTWGWSRVLANGSLVQNTGAPFASFAALRARVEQDTVLFHDDDVFATVLVAASKGGPHRFMRINGKVDASNGQGDIDTQILAGHLGVLMHPREVKNVLLIGAGAAITAGSILAHPIERLDLVEISPAVIEGARHFAADNRHALEDPRVHVTIEDAKTFMALSPRKYDLVVSVPSNPWVAGVSGLFTHEFFEHVAKHMTDDGVLVQWIHTYASDAELVKLVLRTMRTTFPSATTWLGPFDLAMVATRSELQLDLETVERRMARPEVREDLARVEVPDLFTLLARQVHGSERQAAFAGEGPLNTDDHNRLEYDSPRAFYLRQHAVLVQDSRRSPVVDRGMYLNQYLSAHTPTPEQWRNAHRKLAAIHPPDDALVRSIAERWHQADPASDEATRALASAALAQSDTTFALTLLTELVQRPDAPAETMAEYLWASGQRLYTQRSLFHRVDVELARQVLARARASYPDDAQVKEAASVLCAILADCDSPTATASPAPP